MTEENPIVVRDIWDAILNDSWMNIVIWGKPRTGKTTVQMQLAYAVYKDWDQVLQSFVYNLSGILYNMEHGIPCRIMTRNKLHDRVPVLMPDDFGAHSNKAKTQHEPAMDIFKGAIDTYATKIAVLISSMGQPNSLTQQLTEKYTHEIYVACKGEAKYDTIDWEQNFRGFQPRQKKKWLQSFAFYEVPLDVYKQYDEQRLNLVDELNQLIKDCMVENEAARVIARMEDADKDLLSLIQSKGTLHKCYFEVEEHAKLREVLKRCKARSLVIPVKRGTQYVYDLTDFGFEVLQTIQKMGNEGEQAKVSKKALPK
jgi:site-specific DNA-adenine methylase